MKNVSLEELGVDKNLDESGEMDLKQGLSLNVEYLLKEHEALSYLFAAKQFNLEFGDEVLLRHYMKKVFELVRGFYRELVWGEFVCNEDGLFYDGVSLIEECSCGVGVSGVERAKLIMGFLVLPYVFEVVVGSYRGVGGDSGEG